MGHWTYLILEVVWAAPIVIIQWLIGLDAMLQRWKIWLPGIIVPTLYLTFADAFALGAHTWTISPDSSLNILLPFGVPIEEFVFFLLTNTLVVQGLILFASPQIRTRTQRLWRVLRRGPAAVKAEADAKVKTGTHKAVKKQ